MDAIDALFWTDETITAAEADQLALHGSGGNRSQSPNSTNHSSGTATAAVRNRTTAPKTAEYRSTTSPKSGS